MFSELIVKFAYYLEGSDTYYNIKHFFYLFLEDTRSVRKKYFDFMMIFLVLSTVGILIYEVNHKPEPWLDDYETFAIIIFIFEWLGRLWVVNHSHKIIIKDFEKAQLINQPFNLKKSINTILKEKLAFIFSPMSIIDLLAILPYYRPLRILRILMLFRLFKLLRYANSIKQFSDVFIEKRFEFFTLTIMFLMAVTFGSAVIFIYEGAGTNPNINNFFDAVYWSIITISTVGFGDIAPVTIEGRVATIFLVITGLAVIAFFTSIVTTALGEKLIALKEEKVIGEANALKDFVLICGYGRMGEVLAKEFRKVKQKFIVIDINEDSFLHANSLNISYIKGDASDADFLAHIGINKGATSIIALTNNDAVNLSIVLTARSLNPNINIIARANDKKIKKKLFLAGANDVVAANEITGLVAAEYIGQPIAFNAIDDILLDNEGALLGEIEIFESSSYIDHTLEYIRFEDFNLTLIGIIEANTKKFIFNPQYDKYVLNKHDILIVIGFEDAIKSFRIEILSHEPKPLIDQKEK
jgi:voltage-gated potassium channel